MADENAVDFAGPYLLAIKDMVLFTIFVPGLPDWEESEIFSETLARLECEVAGALPSEVQG